MYTIKRSAHKGTVTLTASLKKGGVDKKVLENIENYNYGCNITKLLC